MKKVLFISESQGWSGGAAQLLHLAKGLRAGDLGWDVKLASPEDGEVARRAREAGIVHIPLHPRQDYDLITARRLARILESEEVDILHAHHPRAHAVGLASLYLSRRRPAFVVTRRVSFAIPKNIFSRLKYCSSRIDGFIAVADSVGRELVAGGVPPGKVMTIPSGVDTELFRPAPDDGTMRRELGLPEGVPVVGKIANYSDWKGQAILIDAAARMLGRGRKAVFLFAGRDTDGAPMRELVRKAGLPEGTARLLGFRTDISRLLSVCGISVNAAVRGEGISGALRESLAMEVPVAASDAGGNAELVREGVTGRLFAAGSGADLARVLGEMLDDPRTAKRQAAEGRRVVRERFSIECMVRATDAHYRKLLSLRAGDGA
ncbi:MAG: glycosyltransferase family 4 protein [Elusimicrobiota bacterium]